MRLLIASFALLAASSAISEDALADLIQNAAQDVASTLIRKVLA